MSLYNEKILYRQILQIRQKNPASIQIGFNRNSLGVKISLKNSPSSTYSLLIFFSSRDPSIELFPQPKTPADFQAIIDLYNALINFEIADPNERKPTEQIRACLLVATLESSGIFNATNTWCTHYSWRDFLQTAIRDIVSSERLLSLEMSADILRYITLGLVFVDQLYELDEDLPNNFWKLPESFRNTLFEITPLTIKLASHYLNVHYHRSDDAYKKLTAMPRSCSLGDLELGLTLGIQAYLELSQRSKMQVAELPKTLVRDDSTLNNPVLKLLVKHFFLNTRKKPTLKGTDTSDKPKSSDQHKSRRIQQTF